MEAIFFIIGIISIPLAGILSALLYLYKSQINNLKNQIDFIKENDTNLKLSCTLNNKSIINIINSINSILTESRENKLLLKKVNHSYKESITSISHDIRTPLTSISGYIQMLNSQNISYAKRAEYIKVIENRMDAVTNMLDQLFEFSRLESNEMNLERNIININNILRDSISLFYDKFNESSLTPLITIPDTSYNILGDENALHRVFINIINNALVHGDDDFVITSKNFDNKYQIIFQNKTSSILESDIPNIFERFFTTDKSRTKKTTGLGLAISKKLVNSMEGNIYANIINNKFSIILEFNSVT